MTGTVLDKPKLKLNENKYNTFENIYNFFCILQITLHNILINLILRWRNLDLQ